MASEREQDNEFIEFSPHINFHGSFVIPGYFILLSPTDGATKLKQRDAEREYMNKAN